MKLENNIGWCDATINAVTGCDKVSAGCTHCYAQIGTRARVLRAQGIETWGPKGVRHPVNFEPTFRRLNKLCVYDKCHRSHPVELLSTITSHFGKDRPSWCFECGGQLRRIRLFADSNSDWLDERWPIETLTAFLKAIYEAPNVDVLLLTKRPENWSERLHAAMRVIHDGTDELISQWLDGEAPGWVWLGVSVENQRMADVRVPQLLEIPAAVRFLSCEPLLSVVNLRNIQMACGGLDCLTGRSHDGGSGHGLSDSAIESIDWIIVGGESGKNWRDCGVEAIASIAEQCRGAGTACYVKQDCAFKSGEQGRIPEGVWGLKGFPKIQNPSAKIQSEGGA